MRAEANRNDRIDSVKYWLIILVIAGHVFGQRLLSDSAECTVAWHWIYLFHMPLFVFLSGYFTRKKEGKEFGASCWKLIEPLIIFQILMRAVGYFTTGTLTLRGVLTPWWVLWYLLSLLCWRALIQVIPDRILSKKKMIVALAFVVSLLAGFLPFDRLLSLQRTLAFLPFFLLGYSMRGRNLFIASKYRVWSVLFLILTMALPIFFGKYLGDLNQAEPYDSPMNVFSRMLVWGLSVPMSIAFINICPDLRWSSKQGRLTMQYFIYHAVVIDFLMRIVGKYDLPVSFGAALVYIILIILGLGLLLKLPLFTKLTNPSRMWKTE